MIINGRRPTYVRMSTRIFDEDVQDLVPRAAWGLLAYLGMRVDFANNALPKDGVYHHHEGAAACGIPLRTARHYFLLLEQAKLLRSERRFRGLWYRLLGLPADGGARHEPSGKWQPAATSIPDQPAKWQPAAPSEMQVAEIRTPSVNPLPLPIDSEDSEKRGGKTAAVVQATASAPPPQILIYDEVFRPKREKPLELWRWSCITSVVGLDPRSLEGWRRACERWLGNNQDAEKVVTLVTSYREKFQPQMGPGSPGQLPAAAAAPPPEAEIRPLEPVRIVAPAAIRDALKHRRGPLKDAIAGVLATAEVVA